MVPTFATLLPKCKQGAEWAREQDRRRPAVNRTDAGVNLLGLRSHNTALVLDLLRTAGGDGISRLELAERTGLTPQAVSKITARLRQEGLAAEAGRRASTGGKPRTVLRLVPEAGHAVGVHLDRDELRVVLARLDGRVVRERRTPLSLGAGARPVLDAVTREVTRLLAAGPPDAPSTAAAVAAGAEAAGAGTTAAVAESSAVAAHGIAVAAVTPDRIPVAPALLGVGVALPGPLDHARGCCTGSPASPNGTGSRCATPWRSGSAHRWSSTRTPTRPRSVSRSTARAAPSPASIWAPASARDSSSAGPCTVARAPARVSSGTRSSSWTGRPAPAAIGAVSRPCAWPPSAGGHR